jgi:hypothetical protein
VNSSEDLVEEASVNVTGTKKSSTQKASKVTLAPPPAGTKKTAGTKKAAGTQKGGK